MKRVHIHYSGNVQGVGFRYTVCDIARQYGIKGWVKNRGDGGVEVVAEGTEAGLNAFLDSINSQMSRYIHERKLSWEPATKEFADFQIIF
ncbi:MAG: acylphosphatase [bacterium]